MQPIKLEPIFSEAAKVGYTNNFFSQEVFEIFGAVP